MTKIIDVKINNIGCSEYLLIMPCTKEEFEENFNEFSKDDTFIVIKSEKNLIVIKNDTEENIEENVKHIEDESVNVKLLKDSYHSSINPKKEESIVVKDIPVVVPTKEEYSIVEVPKSTQEYKVDIKTYTPTTAEEVVESKYIKNKIGYIERR